MDCNNLNNNRTVSNLTFVSKVIERAVAFQLKTYLINNNLNESPESAHKSGHITETVLVLVKNDIMMSIDHGKPVILVFLDLSAAFDTVDHNVLFSMLKYLGVISDKCINIYEHITSVCRAPYYHLKNIHCLKALLTQVALFSMVHAFITSRIENCYSLLYGTSDYNTNRLQHIQNSAACMVTNTQK